jgi:predicted nucleic acid-binding protein
VRIFFDSSAYAKRYIEEPGSQTVDKLCMAATEFALNIVCLPEIISVLNRWVRERVLTPRHYQEVKERLLEEVQDIVIINLTPSVISTCTAILEHSPVRAMDALHIACAVQWDAELFVSADRRQISAARKAGLRTRFV